MLGAIVLTSCGTQHPALRYNPETGQKVVDYGEVATSKMMASTVPEVFDTGPRIREKMLQLIESASDYILVDSFLVVNEPETSEVMEALKRKRHSGVRIYLIADSSSRYTDSGAAVYSFLEDAEIAHVEYNPIRIYKLPVAPIMLRRDHRKFWVIDGKILFLGGANIYPASLRRPSDGGNIDLMVAVESREAIESMIASFIATWNASSSEKLDQKDFQVRARPSGEGRLWVADQNRDLGRREVVAKMFGGLFAVAQREIWLIQPYTFVTSDMEEQIRELSARGVEVNFMLSEKVHAPRFHYGSHYGIKDILEAGGKVWVYEAGNGALHAKAIVVDGRWASIGSANLNSRSYHFSKEANLVFGDRKSVKAVELVIDKLKKRCRPVLMEEAKQYRSIDYYFTWLVMQLMG